MHPWILAPGLALIGLTRAEGWDHVLGTDEEDVRFVRSAGGPGSNGSPAGHPDRDGSCRVGDEAIERS